MLPVIRTDGWMGKVKRLGIDIILYNVYNNSMKPSKSYISKHDRLAQIACIKKAGEVCERCGTSEGLCGHHIAGRRNMPIRWSPENLICLCVACHAYAHSQPTAFKMWLEAIRESK
jgi:5-methylcytosine-specific restriction endonuclease McrA